MPEFLILWDGFLKPADELYEMLELKGIHREDHLVTYCTAGIRSAYVQVILEMLGFGNTLNYDDSFYVWANESDAPLDGL